jgi:hypothetical protein
MESVDSQSNIAHRFAPCVLVVEVIGWLPAQLVGVDGVALQGSLHLLAGGLCHRTAARLGTTQACTPASCHLYV